MPFIISFLFAANLISAEADKPLTPVAARGRVGEKVVVEMVVKVAKDRLEKRGEIYLDSEEDFRDDKNFAAVITRAGAAKLRAAGIDDIAGHYMSQTIQVTGTVMLVEGVPRIEVDEAEQIKLVKRP